MSQTFIEMCLEGRVLLDEVEAHVSAWADSKSEIPLSAYLGMSEEEFEFWDHRPGNLRIIIASRDRNVSLEDVRSDAGKTHYSARVTPVREKREIEDWLQDNGYLSRS